MDYGSDSDYITYVATPQSNAIAVDKVVSRPAASSSGRKVCVPLMITDYEPTCVAMSRYTQMAREAGAKTPYEVQQWFFKNAGTIRDDYRKRLDARIASSSCGPCKWVQPIPYYGEYTCTPTGCTLKVTNPNGIGILTKIESDSFGSASSGHAMPEPAKPFAFEGFSARKHVAPRKKGLPAKNGNGKK